MGEAVYVAKKLLRTNLMKSLKCLDENVRKNESKAIQELIMNHTAFKNSKIVCLYIPLIYECNTFDLIKCCENSKKRMFVPKVVGKKDMEFYEAYSCEDILNFPKSKLGILEPKDDNNRIKLLESGTQADLLLLPGVGFDRECNRLGHGYSFYDTFQTKYYEKFGKNMIRMGMGLNCQIVDKIPHNEKDIRLDYVITPTSIFENK